MSTSAENHAGATGENLAEDVTAAKTDIKARAKAKAAQTKDAVTERFGGPADHAAKAAQETVTQAKDKVSGLAKGARDAATAADANSLTRPVAAAGLAVVVTVWMWRRRARRNANPWRRAAVEARSQIKTVRQQAKAGVKEARKQTRKHAAAQVAAAQAKAKTARKRAKSWG
jgi:hypothetical protein